MRINRLFIAIFVAFSGLVTYAQGEQQAYFPPPQPIGGNNSNGTEALPKRELNLTEKVIFTDRELYKILDVKINNYLFAINRLEGLNIALYPKILFLRNSIPIKVHKEFLTKVIFRTGDKIVKVLSSSSDFKELTYTDNVLFIQPKKTLTACNLEVFIQNPITKERKIVELQLTQFDPYLQRDKGKVLYTTYLLIPPKPVAPYKVLDFFYITKGYYPSSPETITIAGIPYKIIPNPKPPIYPNVSTKNKDYYVYPLIELN